MATRLFGASILRRHDGRLLRGEGRYLDDIRRPGLLHVALVRSLHAHAVVREVRTGAARRMAGVVDVVTARDLGTAARPFPLLLPHRGLAAATWSALAGDRVRFAGEAVAAVVAEDVYQAVDAAAAVEVDYEPLAPVLDVEAAVRPDSAQVHADAPGNVAMQLVQQCGDARAAMRGALHVLRERFRITRGGGQPIETRGVLAEVDDPSGELRVWSSTQEPHTVRETIATVLDLEHRTIRVIAPDTGGGFGAKLNVYPEEVLIPWLARRLRRPVKWVETRREHLLSTTQERDQVHDVEVGFDADGRIVALHDRFLHDMGAYAPRGGAVPHNTSSALPGPYRIAHLHCEMVAVYDAQSKPLRPFTFILDFLPYGEYTPYFTALDKGWYREEGLDVKILRGAGGGDTIKRIAVGQGDAGSADFSGLVAARANEEVKVRAIGAYFRRPPHSIFVREGTGINAAKDLEGRRCRLHRATATRSSFRSSPSWPASRPSP